MSDEALNENLRFFTTKTKNNESLQDNVNISEEERIESDELENESNSCILRLAQKVFRPCLKKKNIWEASQTDVFKAHEVEETKYPKILKILENPFFDILFALAAFFSIFLFTFSEGFLGESKYLIGLIHLVNTIYIFGLFSIWTQVLVKSKYSKTNQGYTKWDVVYTLLCVFPFDLIVLGIYSINEKEVKAAEDKIILSLSRINYLLRIRHIYSTFNKWENLLLIGDFQMFLIRMTTYGFLIIHMFACIWHRVACDNFKRKHFFMVSNHASLEVCHETSWIRSLIDNDKSPLFRENTIPVLLTHYFVSLYWSMSIAMRLGYGDISIHLSSNAELIISVVNEIIMWIFSLAIVSGTLTSLLIESDTERENFIIRRFAIEHYMNFTRLKSSIVRTVRAFYDFLWHRRKGIIHIELVDSMPDTMKGEVFFEVNKFVIDQLPLMADLEETFLMKVCVSLTHIFHLKGEILFKRKAIGYRMFYVIKGFLEILSDDESLVIGTIRSGSIIGELLILHRYPHVSTVRCGSECDLLVLTRNDFKKILNLYPNYRNVLQDRIETRLNQSELLLQLSETNEYSNAYKKLKEKMQSEKFSSGEEDEDKGNHERKYSRHRSSDSYNLGNLIKSQEPRSSLRKRTGSALSGDDGLDLTPEVLNKLEQISQREQEKEETRERRRFSLEEEMCAALASDAERTRGLAKDLGIPLPPLNIAPPSKSISKDPQTHKRPGLFQRSITVLKGNTSAGEATWRSFFWKFFVASCVSFVICFYPYQFAFRTADFTLEYLCHLFDLVFAIDCVVDILEPVVTPQKTLELYKEILGYRVKTLSFYVRIFAWLPIEYILAPVATINEHGLSPYYYLFKLNRLIEIIVIFQFARIFEATMRVSAILFFCIKGTIGLLYTVHIAAVFYEFILRDIILFQNAKYLNETNINSYEFPFYWSTQIVFSTGFGDIPYRHDIEIVVICLSLIVGTCVLTYLTAKIAAILANGQRRRVTFKQIFFAVQTFMKQRRFPKELFDSITRYYEMQWAAHDGVLIPSDKSAIWDAPKGLIKQVCMFQAMEFIKRLPFSQYKGSRKDLCLALKQYFIPPDEIILYPYDKRREIYIIVKGHCDVILDSEIIGKLGTGNYFGLSGFLHGSNGKYKIRTKTHCKFFCLFHEDFIKIARKHHYQLENYNFLKNIRKEMKEEAKSKSTEASKSISTEPSYEGAQETRKVNELAVYASLDVQSKPWWQKTISLVLLRHPFLPGSTFLKYWSTFRIICAFCVCGFASAQAIFPFHPTASLIILVVLDLVAYFDLYLMFHVGFYGADKSLVTDPIKTSFNYLTKGFIMDALACYPFDYIAMFILNVKFWSWSEYNYQGYLPLISLLRINRCVQAYRFLLTGKILENIIFKSLTLVTLIQVIPLMYLFIIILGCICISAVCYMAKSSEILICQKSAWITNGAIYQFENKSIITHNTYKLYLTSMYWITATSLGVGYGDIDLIDEWNRGLGIIVIVFGTLVSAFLGAKLTACMVGEDSRRIEIREKMNTVFDFLDHYNVSKEVKARVKEIYFIEWDKTKGIYPLDLFVSLHPSLKSDVTRELYEENLKKVEFLQSIDETGLRYLSTKLREAFYPEGEFIMRYGDLNDDVFIISTGTVVGYNGKGVLINYMGSGSLVGEFSALFGVQRIFTLIACSDTEVYIFTKAHFMKFISEYPELKKTLEEACFKNYRKAINFSKAEHDLDVIFPVVRDGDFEETEDDTKSMDQSLDTTLGTSVYSFPDDSKAESEDETMRESEAKAISSQLTRTPLATDVEITEVKLKSKAQIKKDPKVVLNPMMIPQPQHRELAFQVDFTFDPINEIADITPLAPEAPESQSSKWWAVFLTFGKIPRDEMGLLHIAQDMKKCNIFNFVVHPAAPCCNFVSFFLLLACISCAISSYEIAFVDTSESIYVAICRYIVEAFFVLRLFGNFHFAFYDEETFLLVTSMKAISLRYLKKIDGFFLDFITTFPFDAIPYIMKVENPDAMAAYIRGLQLFRIFLFMRYLNATESDLQMRTSEVKVFKITVLLCFIFHFCACAFYLVSCYGFRCTEGTWMNLLIERMILEKTIKSPKDLTTASRYFISLHYVTNAITYTGASTMSPRTVLEIVVTLSMIFATIFVIGFLVGEMTQCLASQVSSKIHYQHQLSVLEEHLANVGLKKGKATKVRNYYKLLWQKCHGIPYHTLIAELPYPLRADIAFEIYGPNFRNSRILNLIEDNVLRQICARIQHEFHLPGTHIIHHGDICNAMYFIKKGEVVILDENEHLDICVETLYESECFGEVKSLLPMEQFRFSYIASLETEVGKLSREDLEVVLRNYPKLQKELVEKAKKIKEHRELFKEEGEEREGKRSKTLTASDHLGGIPSALVMSTVNEEKKSDHAPMMSKSKQ